MKFQTQEDGSKFWQGNFNGFSYILTGPFQQIYVNYIYDFNFFFGDNLLWKYKVARITVARITS